jgi:hypothetical protein
VTTADWASLLSGLLCLMFAAIFTFQDPRLSWLCYSAGMWCCQVALAEVQIEHEKHNSETTS